ncbi:hypothetical protein E2320_013137, partial [Naja naja]
SWVIQTVLHCHLVPFNLYQRGQHLKKTTVPPQSSAQAFFTTSRPLPTCSCNSLPLSQQVGALARPLGSPFDARVEPTSSGATGRLSQGPALCPAFAHSSSCA